MAKVDKLRQIEAAQILRSLFGRSMCRNHRTRQVLRGTPMSPAVLSQGAASRQGGQRRNGRRWSWGSGPYSSGAHILNLVDDILDISAIEAGKRQLELEQIDLGEVFKVCARTMESRVREKALNFTVFESDPAPIVRTDRRAVLQILLNLLSNAVKFTPPKGRVSLAMESAGDRIIITVEDSGVGIPEDMLQEIMEPFVQSANDPLVTGTGSGLGLSIVKSLCAMIGATVDLESTEEEGTTVRLSIPVSIEDDQSSEDDGG